MSRFINKNMKVVQLIFNSNPASKTEGKGNYRATIPVRWANELGVTRDNKQVLLIKKKDCIIIKPGTDEEIDRFIESEIANQTYQEQLCVQQYSNYFKKTKAELFSELY